MNFKYIKLPKVLNEIGNVLNSLSTFRIHILHLHDSSCLLAKFSSLLCNSLLVVTFAKFPLTGQRQNGPKSSPLKTTNRPRSVSCGRFWDYVLSSFGTIWRLNGCWFLSALSLMIYCSTLGKYYMKGKFQLQAVSSILGNNFNAEKRKLRSINIHWCKVKPRFCHTL